MSTYYITNMVPNPAGFSLAANFRGASSTVDVTQVNNLPTHVWIVSRTGPGDAHTISPQIAPGLYVTPGSDNNLALSTQPYQWMVSRIQPIETGVFLIQDIGSGNVWTLTNATSEQEISLISLPPDQGESYAWLLVPA